MWEGLIRKEKAPQEKRGPTPGETINDRLYNHILRNSMINEAKHGPNPRPLYNCTKCHFWVTEAGVPVCDRCLKETK